MKYYEKITLFGYCFYYLSFLASWIFRINIKREDSVREASRRNYNRESSSESEVESQSFCCCRFEERVIRTTKFFTNSCRKATLTSMLIWKEGDKKENIKKHATYQKNYDEHDEKCITLFWSWTEGRINSMQFIYC